MVNSDPAEVFNQRAADADSMPKPEGEEPDFEVPDLNTLDTVSEGTDKALAYIYLERTRHLYIRGHGKVYVWRSDLKCWSDEDPRTILNAYYGELSGMFHMKLGEALSLINKIRNAQPVPAGTPAPDELYKRAESLEKMARYCEKASVIGNCAKLGWERLNATLGASLMMDYDPELLACRNGVVNLRTGVLRYADPRDRITKSTNTIYDGRADTAEWERIVLQVCGNKPGLAKFFQVWAGYCLTGYTREHCMSIMWGTGRNGKNLLVDALASAMGEYAKALPSGFLEAMGDAAAADNNAMYMTAQLEGVRLAYTMETGERGKLRESWVKAQTGNKTMRARKARQDFFEFPITHKLMVGTNHKPEITGTDNGVWSRIRLIGMTVTFGTQAEIDSGQAHALIDPGLTDSWTRAPIRLSAILRWAADGARMYLQDGLRAHTPTEVADETRAYRRDQDTLGQFLSNSTIWIDKAQIKIVSETEEDGAIYMSRRGMDSNARRLRVEKMDLYRIYQAWCEENGHFTMSATRFARQITTTIRFWVNEDGTEQTMPPLEWTRSQGNYYYRYLLLSDYGQRMLNIAQSKMARTVRTIDRTVDDYVA